jgi:hypothetical protein
MTVAVVMMLSLAPILWESGISSDLSVSISSDVMKPIASKAPLVGGMITSTIHYVDAGASLLCHDEGPIASQWHAHSRKLDNRTRTSCRGMRRDVEVSMMKSLPEGSLIATAIGICF